jgi:hypothetical protein
MCIWITVLDRIISGFAAHPGESHASRIFADEQEEASSFGPLYDQGSMCLEILSAENELRASWRTRS